MGCFTSVKCMMFLFNLLIFLAGATLLAVGILVSVDRANIFHILDALLGDTMQLVNMDFFLISVGGVLVLMSFLGCCAVHKESKCLLLMFFSITLIIFTAEMAAGLLTLAYSLFVLCVAYFEMLFIIDAQAEGILRTQATPALKEQFGSNLLVTNIWNNTMTQWGCCGFSNYTDFNSSWYSVQNGGTYPPSCCLPNSAPCSLEEAKNHTVQGCFEMLQEAIKKNAYILGGVPAGIGVVEIAAMVASMYLYCHLDNNIS